jgi:hypothetical protein
LKTPIPLSRRRNLFAKDSIRPLYLRNITPAAQTLADAWSLPSRYKLLFSLLTITPKDTLHKLPAQIEDIQVVLAPAWLRKLDPDSSTKD